MKIVVVEDEILVARRVMRLSEEVLGERVESIAACTTLNDALSYLRQHGADLLLLDLNLNGEDGFDLLQQAAASSFHTVVISANTDRAIEAFEHGVLDFLGKPFTAERLKVAFDRYDDASARSEFPTKYLSVNKREGLVLLEVEEIRYIKGSGVYAEICLRNGNKELHDKSLYKLEAILPPQFLRVHRSYIVNLDRVRHFRSHGASKYDLVLTNDEALPVSRSRYKELKQRLS